MGICAGCKTDVAAWAYMETIGKNFGLNLDEQAEALKNLLNDGDGLNKFGLANSITKTAHSLPGIGYDRSTELERVGGEILGIKSGAWFQIAAK